MQANIKSKNEKKLEVKALVDSECTHTEINEQLVKDKKIPTKPIDFSFKVFNADGTKNREVTKVASLEIKINGYTEQLEVVVTDLDGTDMFLGHDWLVKHNPKVNWKNSTIWFTRCPGYCTMKHEDIQFNTRRQMAMDKMEQCHIQVHLSGKLYPCSDATSDIYKPAFYGSHLSRNTSHGGAATLQVFHLP